MHAAMTNLVDYIAALSKSADETTRAEDRHIYTQHLAVAAKMFVVAYHGQRAELETLVAGERAAYGRGFLSGAAERALDVFARSVEAERAA
jgi:hypothetical protein